MCEKGKCSGDHHHSSHAQAQETNFQQVSNEDFPKDHSQEEISQSENSSHEGHLNSKSPKAQKQSNSFSFALKSSFYALLALLAGLYLWMAFKNTPEMHFPLTAKVERDTSLLFVKLSLQETPDTTFIYQMVPSSDSSSDKEKIIFFG